MSTLELDLHQLTVVEAKRLIQKIIVSHPKLDAIIAIHGFKHGCVLKEFLINKNNLQNKRVVKTEQNFFNPGRTTIYLRGSLYE